MSRAYLKEDQIENSSDELIPERVQSKLPNYMTPSGIEALSRQVVVLLDDRQRAAKIEDEYLRRQQIMRIDRDLRYFRARLECAIPVNPADLPEDEVHFGSEVSISDASGAEQTWTIVGEDEADVSQGRISYAAPLARVLMGTHVGDVVYWERPNGAVQLEVMRVRNAPT